MTSTDKPTCALSRRSVLRAGSGVALAAGLGGLAVATAPTAAAAAPVSATSIPGLTVKSQTVSGDGRVYTTTFATTALRDTLTVKVLVPAGYATSGKRYPVIHLLHGGVGNSSWWLDSGGVLDAVGNGQAIIVMPDGGIAGWYSDFKWSTKGPRNWETFHIGQIVPWVDATFRTLATPASRAVAGFSMGGWGALKYGAKHPALFSAVASFSGPASPYTGGALVGHWIEASCVVDCGVIGGVWGIPWDTTLVTADDPCQNIGSFAGKYLSFYSGGGDIQENAVRTSHVEFERKLKLAGLPYRFVKQTEGHGLAVVRNAAEELPRVIAHLTTAG